MKRPAYPTELAAEAGFSLSPWMLELSTAAARNARARILDETFLASTDGMSQAALRASSGRALSSFTSTVQCLHHHNHAQHHCLDKISNW